jgi:hypothetical protein
LQGGTIYESEEHFEDPINGEHIPSFDMVLGKHKYQIVPEYAKEFDLLLKEFKHCVSMHRPKGHYRKKFANGAVSVAKAPWNVIKLVTFSLEKISDVTRNTPNIVTKQKYQKSNRK